MAAGLAALLGCFAWLYLNHVPDGVLTAVFVLGVFGLIGSIPGTVSILGGLLSGVTATYVYPNGLVHTRNGRMRVIALVAI